MMKKVREKVADMYVVGLRFLFRDMADSDLRRFAKRGAWLAVFLFQIGIFVTTSWFFSTVVLERAGFEKTVIYLLVIGIILLQFRE